MLFRVAFDGEQYEIPVDTSDVEVGALIAHKRAFEIWKQRLWAEAVATRGLSLQPREHRVTTITREFYLQNGRFPTQSEMLRRLLP